MCRCRACLYLSRGVTQPVVSLRAVQEKGAAHPTFTTVDGRYISDEAYRIASLFKFEAVNAVLPTGEQPGALRVAVSLRLVSVNSKGFALTVNSRADEATINRRNRVQVRSICGLSGVPFAGRPWLEALTCVLGCCRLVSNRSSRSTHADCR